MRFRPSSPFLFLSLTICISAVVILCLMIGMGSYSDELFHLKQINLFRNFQWEITDSLTVIPTYHLFIAMISQLWDSGTLQAIRPVNVALGLLSVLAFYFTAKRIHGEGDSLRTWMYYLLPISFPYFFFVYTDTFSMLLFLISIYLFLSDRKIFGSSIASLNIFVRQTNLLWVPLFFIIAMKNKQLNLTNVLTVLKKIWPITATVVVLGVYMLIHGGVAIKDAGSHRVGLYSGNIYFFFFMYAVLFPIFNIDLLTKYVKSHRTKKWSSSVLVLCLLVISVMVVYFTFRADHHYNKVAGFIRNDLLMFFSS